MFYISPAVKKIMITCVIIFLLQNTIESDSGGNFFNNFFALHSFYSEYFSAYQLITYAFLHLDFSHILLNLLGLWVFGTKLEELFGSKKFVSFLLICAVGSALCHLIYLYISQKELYMMAYYNPYLYQSINAPTMGISGVVYACMAAFAYIFPRDYIYVYFIIPIQVKWLVIILIGYEIVELVQQFISTQNSQYEIAHFAHLGGAATGFIYVYLLYNKFPNKKRWN